MIWPDHLSSITSSHSPPSLAFSPLFPPPSPPCFFHLFLSTRHNEPLRSRDLSAWIQILPVPFLYHTALIELLSPTPTHPSEKWESKYYLIPRGLPDLKYLISESNAWHLGSVPKELVMTITHSPDLNSNSIFLGKPSLTPSGPVRSPPSQAPSPAFAPTTHALLL